MVIIPMEKMSRWQEGVVGVVHMKVHCGGQSLRVGLHLNVWAIAYETSWYHFFWMRS